MIRLLRVYYEGFPQIHFAQAREDEDETEAWDRAHAEWSAKVLADFPASTGALLCPLCRRPYFAHDHTKKPMACPARPKRVIPLPEENQT